MTSRQIKMPAKVESQGEINDDSEQRKGPDNGRYVLQVDRQPKHSYATSEAAQKAGAAIKLGHPVVQVSVYDTVENTHISLAVSSHSS